jgi:hypothetical protein
MVTREGVGFNFIAMGGFLMILEVSLVIKISATTFNCASVGFFARMRPLVNLRKKLNELIKFYFFTFKLYIAEKPLPQPSNSQ